MTTVVCISEVITTSKVALHLRYIRYTLKIRLAITGQWEPPAHQRNQFMSSHFIVVIFEVTNEPFI